MKQQALSTTTRRFPRPGDSSLEHTLESGPRTLAELHVWIGCFWAVTVIGPISLVEIGTGALAAIAIARLPWTWRAYPALLRAPLTWLMLAAILWGAVSLGWTLDPKIGSKHLQVARFGFAVLALWPVRRHRLLFILCMLGGFVLGLLAFPINWIGVRHGIRSLVLETPGSPSRNGGWWPEVIGGELLVVATGLLLPGVLRGRGGIRIGAVLMLGLVLAGIWATGTRAAMLAVPILGLLATLDVARRLGTAKTRAIAALAIVALLSLGTIGIWFAAGSGFRARVSQGFHEAKDALTHQKYDSDTGLRVWMATWGFHAWEDSPWRGVGIGGYQAWVIKHGPREPAPGWEGTRRFETDLHTHAHNTLIQAAATTGIVGAGAWTAAMLAGLLAARRWNMPSPVPNWKTGTGGALSKSDSPMAVFHDGPFWGLVGLVLLIPFDALHVSASLFAAMAGLWALCPPMGPRRER